MSIHSTPAFPRVLLLENVVLFRKMLALTLMHTGLAGVVEEAGDLAGARRLWQTAGGVTDLLIADIHLPDGVGLDFVAEARAARPGLKVMVVSGRLDARTIRAVLALEPEAFLSKEDDLDSLITALRTVAQGRRHFSADLLQMLLEANEQASGWAASLTAREREVARLVAEGADTAATARALGITPATVKVHRHNVLRKLGLPDSRALRQYLTEEETYSD